MGYESRVYVVDVRHLPDCHISDMGILMGKMNLSKCGYEFPKVFAKPVDFDFYEGNEEIGPETTDCYGERLRWATPSEVLEAIPKDEPYGRLKLLRAMLESLASPDWKDSDIRVVHYGY